MLGGFSFGRSDVLIVFALPSWGEGIHGVFECRVGVEGALQGGAPRRGALGLGPGRDPFAVLGVLHGLCEVRPDVVLGKGRVGVGEFPVAHGLRFAFLRVLKDAERVGQQRAVEKPKPAVVFEPGRHGDVASGVHIGGLAPFGHGFHARVVEKAGEGGEVSVPNHACKMHLLA